MKQKFCMVASDHRRNGKDSRGVGSYRAPAGGAGVTQPCRSCSAASMRGPPGGNCVPLLHEAGIDIFIAVVGLRATEDE